MAEEAMNNFSTEEKQIKNQRFEFECEITRPVERTDIVLIPVTAPDKESARKECELICKEQSENFVIREKSRFSLNASVICLLITVFLSFFKFYEKGGFNYISLFPNMLSLLFSIVIYSSFVIKVKGIKDTFKNVWDYIISILVIVTMGIFINIFTGNSVVMTGFLGKFFKYIGLESNVPVILIAAALSWLGISQIAGIAWIVVIFMGMTEFVTCGNYLGNFKSAIFILSAFSGFIFYIKYEGNQILNSFKNIVRSAHKITSDINQSKELIKRAGSFSLNKMIDVVNDENRVQKDEEHHNSDENQQKLNDMSQSQNNDFKDETQT